MSPKSWSSALAAISVDPPVEPAKFALAQLRHLYMLMLDGNVKDTAEAARGLLGPSIARLETELAEWEAYGDLHTETRERMKSYEAVMFELSEQRDAAESRAARAEELLKEARAELEHPDWQPPRELAEARGLVLDVEAYQEMVVVTDGESLSASTDHATKETVYTIHKRTPGKWHSEAMLFQGDSDETVGAAEAQHPDRDEAEARAQAMVAALLERVR